METKLILTNNNCTSVSLLKSRLIESKINFDTFHCETKQTLSTSYVMWECLDIGLLQMGSEVKCKALAKMLKQWHVEVRERRKNREQLKSFSFRHTNMSSEWSQVNKTAPDFSSTLCESIRSSDEGEIVEELEHMEKTKASSSSDPPCVV